MTQLYLQTTKTLSIHQPKIYTNKVEPTLNLQKQKLKSSQAWKSNINTVISAENQKRKSISYCYMMKDFQATFQHRHAAFHSIVALIFNYSLYRQLNLKAHLLLSTWQACFHQQNLWNDQEDAASYCKLQ